MKGDTIFFLTVFRLFLDKTFDLWAHSTVPHWKSLVHLRWELHGDRRGHQHVLR